MCSAGRKEQGFNGQGVTAPDTCSPYALLNRNIGAFWRYLSLGNA